ETRKARQELAKIAFSPLDGKDPMELIYDAIRRGVLASLTSKPWERTLGRAQYGTLIGARTQDDEALDAQRSHLHPVVTRSDIAEAYLGEHAPLLTKDVRELVRLLNDRRTVRISLQLDLSSSPYGRLHNDGE